MIVKDNIFERENFFNQWKDKVNTITFQNMIDMSVFTNQQEQSIFIDNCKSRGVRVDDFLCDHLWGIPIIDVDGNIIPCGMPVRDFTKDFILGNINDGDTIKDVWSSDKFNKLRNIHKNGNIENINICNGCAYSQHNSKIELSSIIMDDL